MSDCVISAARGATAGVRGVSGMQGPPDFFLTAVVETGPGVDLARVRACWTEGRLASSIRDDYMLVEVDPPVLGERFGLWEGDLTEVVIAPRTRGEGLFWLARWPCPVYVFRVLDQKVTESLSITRADQMEMFAWAEIYRTREEAERVGGSAAERVESRK